MSKTLEMANLDIEIADCSSFLVEELFVEAMGSAHARE